MTAQRLTFTLDAMCTPLTEEEENIVKDLLKLATGPQVTKLATIHAMNHPAMFDKLDAIYIKLGNGRLTVEQS